MRQWFILFNKEMLEMTRNFKWIWVPIAFILLGSMDPLTTYYMPQILDSLGGLPEGTIIEMPIPPAPEILTLTLGQYNLLGVLIIVLISMGIISGERKSGVAGIILVKPVAYSSYITAKWASALLLLWVSFFVGFLASWYYIGILFEWIPFVDFIQAFLFYGIWLSFILTVTIFLNSFFKTPGVVGFISIAMIIAISFVSGALSHLLEWSPALLPSYVGESLVSNSFSADIVPASLVAIGGMIVLLVAAFVVFRRKELAA